MNIITKYINKNYDQPITQKVVGYFLKINKFLWGFIPWNFSFRRKGIVRSYGCFLHGLVQINDKREQNPWSFFLRNRRELDYIHGLAARLKPGSDLNIAIIACSTGMEPYSLNWRLKNLRSQVNISIKGMDILNESLEIAKKGEYLLDDFEQHLSKLTVEESESMFTFGDGKATVKPHLKELIQWYQGDACNVELKSILGKQDIVMANRFLCHMQPKQAEVCLNNVINLVADNGYLFVTGIDLDVRQRVMEKAGFTPIFDQIDDIHNGDSTLIYAWPWLYWGLEPLPRNKKKITNRYVMVWKKTVVENQIS